MEQALPAQTEARVGGYTDVIKSEEAGQRGAERWRDKDRCKEEEEKDQTVMKDLGKVAMRRK